jgi:hypothetical protein
MSASISQGEEEEGDEIDVQSVWISTGRIEAEG